MSTRVDEIFDTRYNALAQKTDRLFGYLFLFQWLLGIVFALLISPRTWAGEYSQTHIHVYAAVLLGGLIAALPMYLIFTKPGATINRMVVAVSQILFSVLFIHLTGGRIETHFHIFGSLAFLAFYRDWRPVLIGTVITTVDHLVRGAFWPESVYGVLTATPWRALEHAGWVIFEDCILWYSIKLALSEMRSVAESQVELETALIETKAAHRSAENYRYALDASTIVAITDSQGRITHANDNFCQISKYTKEELLGKTHRLINSGFHTKAFFENLWATISSGKVWSGEIQNKAKDGTLYWVDSVIVPLFNEYGKLKEYLAIRKDVTAKKILEEAILEKQTELKKAVAAAENANQTKSLFLANISHELRTPMHGILSFAKFGQQKVEAANKEKLKSYFDEIYDSGNRLLRLLNDLLDLSKLEAGKMDYSMQEGDLIEVSQSAQDQMHALIIEKNLKVKMFSEKSKIPGTFDSQRLGQVIRNLLSNAIKFSENGGTIKITLDQTPEKIKYCVINKGLGIPAAELKSVFDKFTQSSKTRTNAGGTGLGLSICKEIIQGHGGTIWAESILNGETKFTFELPVVMAKLKQKAS